jgi:hypothetical protein
LRRVEYWRADWCAHGAGRAALKLETSAAENRLVKKMPKAMPTPR